MIDIDTILLALIAIVLVLDYLGKVDPRKGYSKSMKLQGITRRIFKKLGLK